MARKVAKEKMPMQALWAETVWALKPSYAADLRATVKKGRLPEL